MAEPIVDFSNALNPGGEEEQREKAAEDHILKITEQYYQEADGARTDRMARNRRNRDAYMERQDWSHKERGQSTEYIPKTGSAIESFSAFIKRGLTSFGNFFSASVPDGVPVRGDDIVSCLNSFLMRMPQDNGKVTSFPHIVSDGVKSALQEAYFVMKIHGMKIEKKTFEMKADGSTKVKTIKPWKLRIDLIPNEDYFEDPTGGGMYEIHEVEKDLSSVIEMAEMGQYDLDVVADMMLDDEERKETLEVQDRKRDKHLDETEKPVARKKVVLKECWGNILDEDGTILHRNVTWTIANDKYLLRKPLKNPYWHGRSPFMKIPIIRVPHTVLHKALFDGAVSLNEAMNELFNLMLDGGIGSVWGVRQIRVDWLEDPRQVSDGISQATTLLVNESAPADAEVLKELTTGEVPRDALAMYNLLDKEFNAAALTNDIKLGLLPTKEVKATEIVEASQSQAVTLDAIVADMEWYIAEALKMCWMNVVQNTDDIETLQVDTSGGRRLAVLLARMDKAQRFAIFGSMTGFAVYGLSATMARARDFQSLMALLQAIQVNPMLMQAFHRRYSEDKVLMQLMRQTNINPEMIERSPEEIAQIDAEVAQAAKLQQAGVTGNQTSGQPGAASEQSAVSQAQQPTAGI